MVGDVPKVAGGEDARTQSTSPKHHQMDKGEPTRKRKKIVQRTLLTMIIPQEEVVQFPTDLLASTLLIVPAQEDIPVHSSGVADAANILALNSPYHTAELPPTSGTGSLLDTAIVPPSSMTAGLVFTSKL